MNDIDKMPSKCHDCPYWEACDYPYICPDVGKDQTSRENNTKITGYSQDTISRQAAIDALKKAYWDANLQSAKDDPCVIDAMTDWAIRQIKALQPVQPKTATITIGRTRGETTMWYECDACGEPVDWNDCYCRKCGRRLMHE